MIPTLTPTELKLKALERENQHLLVEIYRALKTPGIENREYNQKIESLGKAIDSLIKELHERQEHINHLNGLLDFFIYGEDSHPELVQKKAG